MELTLHLSRSPGFRENGTFKVGWASGQSDTLVVRAETREEEKALTALVTALESVLPNDSIFLDVDPVLRPDGHDGMKPTGQHTVSARIHLKAVVLR